MPSFYIHGGQSSLTYSLENLAKAFGMTKSAHSDADFIIEPQKLISPPNFDNNSALRNLYHILVKQCGNRTGWGILTGMRPVKLAYLSLKNLDTDEKRLAMLQNEYLISAKNARLILEIAKLEQKELIGTNKKISLYISIPFCPSRCSFCSFPALSLETKSQLLPEYFAKLQEELTLKLDLLLKLGREIDCIYVGGGTPSVLSSEQIKALFDLIYKYIPRENFLEITFEAGRTDSIDRGRLEALKESGVQRVSVNPQTFNKNSLVSIGRPCSTKEFEKSFAMAYDMGFIVNSDLILGLEGETAESYLCGLEQLIAKKPQNITVHALALKRGSRLNYLGGFKESDRAKELIEASESGDDALRRAGYQPYYLYRQKNIAGNLENVGYCLKKTRCLYNMRIMEEQHTIIASGVGAVSKICFPDENRHERVANSRSVEDYILKFDKVLESIKNLENMLY